MSRDLPRDEAQLPGQARRLDPVCDRFEAEWLAGGRPRLEDFLSQVGEADRSALLGELLPVELYHRARGGEQATAKEYHRRLPEYAAVIDAAFAAVAATGPEGSAAPIVRDADGSSAVAPRANGEALPLRAGRYEIEGEIAHGGMGAVWRARDPELNRTLAIKVLRLDFHGWAELERRFREEAQITGQLQHPGIPPVHEVGTLPDGRPFFAMKLIKGQTLADLLKQRGAPGAELPRFLGIFEQVCQAVAYAHSQGVIHRDLKPLNVMVGAFGEVQVMDWGLAKVLAAEARVGAADVAGIVVETEGRSLTQVGVPLGTYAYMAPEQARGEVGRLDQRCDVFGLGAILCTILTGQPPHAGASRDELLAKAKTGDLAEALARLEACGADAELVALAQRCLAAEASDRPRDAEVVAAQVAAYQAAVQERLRKAELERAAAEAREQEAQATAAADRKARRRTRALAVTVVLLLAGSVTGAWWVQQERAAAQARQAQTDREALAVLGRAAERLDEGWQLQDLAQLTEVKAAAERAATIARNGGASDGVGQQVAAFQAEAQERIGRAERNQALLSSLLDIVTPHETKIYEVSESGLVMVRAEPSADEQYASAFRRRWPDIDIDKQGESAVAARLQEEPEVVLLGVIAGLDGWMLERRLKRPEAEWRRLLGLVDRLDPSEPRRQLRAVLIGASPPPAASVAGLLGGWPPWTAFWELARGHDWRQLRQVRGRMDASAESVLTVLLLARASSAIGDMAGAEEVLRQSLPRRPGEVALLDTLGKVLERQRRLADAIGCYRAARARHPGLGVSLGKALGDAGQVAEGEAVLRDLIRQQPKNPEMFFALGNALDDHGKHADAEAAFGQAIALKPDYPEAHYNLGAARFQQGRYKEAEAACGEALRLKPDYPEARDGLGAARFQQGRFPEAEADHRAALDLKPDFPQAHHGLGVALFHQRHYKEAEEEYREALRLKPDYLAAQHDLGLALARQDRHKEAEAAYRAALRLKPDYSQAYCDLGIVLSEQGRFTEALEELRRFHALRSKVPGRSDRSAALVRQCERLVELDRMLPAVLRGNAEPASPSERLELAGLCQLACRGRYAAAARLYAEAFAADPKLADDLDEQYRYDAACSAARAAAGQAEDAKNLPDKVRQMLRRQALRGLRADLTVYTRDVVLNTPRFAPAVRQRLGRWREDTDLASVREQAAIDKLPDDESREWRRLWLEVADLLKKVELRK